MKPGDKVWFIVCNRHDVVRVVSGEVSYIQSEYIRIPDEPRLVTVRDEYGIPFWRVPYDLVFPTREALCEHYRKIFE